MMKSKKADRELKEKYFIALAHPDVDLVDIEVCTVSAGGIIGDTPPAHILATEEARSAYLSGKRTAGISMKFHFRDDGAKMRQKYVTLPKEVRFYTLDENGESTKEEYFFRSFPGTLYPIADTEGFFDVSLDFLLNEEKESTLESPLEPGTRFLFSIKIGNQFVDEYISYIGKLDDEVGAYWHLRRKGYSFREQKGSDWFDTVSAFI